MDSVYTHSCLQIIPETICQIRYASVREQERREVLIADYESNWVYITNGMALRYGYKANPGSDNKYF
jgi:hypothetical protein